MGEKLTQNATDMRSLSQVTDLTILLISMVLDIIVGLTETSKDATPKATACQQLHPQKTLQVVIICQICSCYQVKLTLGANRKHICLSQNPKHLPEDDSSYSKLQRLPQQH